MLEVPNTQLTDTDNWVPKAKGCKCCSTLSPSPLSSSVASAGLSPSPVTRIQKTTRQGREEECLASNPPQTSHLPFPPHLQPFPRLAAGAGEAALQPRMVARLSFAPQG